MKAQKKKTIFFNKPSKYKCENKRKLPNVMKWSGKVDGVPLSNTCTIDNGLTLPPYVLSIVHIFNRENSRFKQILADEQRKMGQLLRTVLMLMSKQESSAAKAVWAGLTDTECQWSSYT